MALFTFSHHEGHVTLVRKFSPLAQPEAVVDGESVNGDGQVFRVNLRELLTARIISERLKIREYF